MGLLAEDIEAARESHGQALLLWRDAGDRWGTAAVLQSLTVLAGVRGRHDEAITLGEEALAIFEATEMPERVADMRCSLGRANYARGDLDRAHELLQASLALAREIEDPYAIGQALNALALVSVDRGEFGPATSLFGESLETWLEMGTKNGIASALSGIATLATAQRHWEMAGRMFGAVSAMATLIGHDPHFEHNRHVRAEQEATALGGQSFFAARDAGRVLELEEAIAAAGAYLAPGVSKAAPSFPRQSNVYGLTPRELDVLLLVARGLSDREIADALFISRYTAMRHVANILGKMAVGSRTAAASRAHQAGLA